MILLWLTLILLHQGYALVPVIRVQLGQPVTVTCALSEALQSVSWLYWYKQSAGDTLKLVSMLRKNTNPTYGPGFSASRFNTSCDDKMSNLTILKIATEDEGMYHCAYINWLQTTWSGAYLSLKGTRTTSNYKVVQQPAVSHSANPADSMSLQCSFLTDSDQTSCSDGPSMFWIRAGSDKSDPLLIYTDGKRSGICEKRADIQKRCFHNFSINASSSDVGTYYCAVVTCGEILFGNGANLNIQATESGLWPSEAITVTFVLSTVLAISLIALLIVICSPDKNKCEHCQAPAKLQKPLGQNSQQRVEDRRVYTAAVFTVMETNTETTKSPEKQMFAALKAFGL